MRKKILTGAMVGMAFLFAVSVVPSFAFADDAVRSTPEVEQTRGEILKTRLQEMKQARQEAKDLRLAEAQLRACENRKTKISATMTRSITRAERQLALFSTIADRVKAFYVDKGYSVDNYDDLVAAVDAAKADAQANLETLKGLSDFECDAEDPKGDIEAFKLALRSINQDLKDYRTSVKNLIVGVKSGQSSSTGREDGGEE